MPVFVLPRFPTARLSVFDDPGVPAGPRLFPVVPWLLALLAFAPGAPPVPFTVTPLLRVVPELDEVPPVEVPGEEAPPAAEPPDEPPLEPLPAANACWPPNDKLATMTTVMNFMTAP